LSGGRDPDDVLNVPRDRINSGLDALIYIADHTSESLDGPGLSLSNPAFSAVFSMKRSAASSRAEPQGAMNASIASTKVDAV
jgi:hypothetical protein